MADAGGKRNCTLLQQNRRQRRLAAFQRIALEQGGWKAAEKTQGTLNRRELEFEEKKNRQIYWDDVAMFCHFQEYELGIYPMQEGDLIEIDDFSELCELDPSYCGYEAQGQKKSEEK